LLMISIKAYLNSEEKMYLLEVYFSLFLILLEKTPTGLELILVNNLSWLPPFEVRVQSPQDR